MNESQRRDGPPVALQASVGRYSWPTETWALYRVFASSTGRMREAARREIKRRDKLRTAARRAANPKDKPRDE